MKPNRSGGEAGAKNL